MKSKGKPFVGGIHQNQLNVQKNKPELLTEYVRLSMFDIDKMSFQEIRDIYIQVKSRYYDTLDYSTKF